MSTANRSLQPDRGSLQRTLLMAVILSTAGGCATSDGPPRERRLSANEALNHITCRRGDRAVCTERMGELVECFCSTDGAFRKMIEL